MIDLNANDLAKEIGSILDDVLGKQKDDNNDLKSNLKYRGPFGETFNRNYKRPFDGLDFDDDKWLANSTWCNNGSVNIFKGPKGYKYVINALGFDKKDISIKCNSTKKTIEITGSLPKVTDEYTQIISHGMDKRAYVSAINTTIFLSKDCNADTMTAKLENGLLKIYVDTVAKQVDNINTIAID